MSSARRPFEDVGRDGPAGDRDGDPKSRSAQLKSPDRDAPVAGHDDDRPGRPTRGARGSAPATSASPPSWRRGRPRMRRGRRGGICSRQIFASRRNFAASSGGVGLM